MLGNQVDYRERTVLISVACWPTTLSEQSWRRPQL